MELTLSKASRVYSDCSAIESKLHAMTFNAEEEVRTEKNKAAHLIQLAARTFTKGLHCLSLRLTTDYYSLLPEEQEFPNREKLHQLDLYHYAVFSDNILACAVVVNSTISTAMVRTASFLFLTMSKSTEISASLRCIHDQRGLRASDEYVKCIFLSHASQHHGICF